MSRTGRNRYWIFTIKAGKKRNSYTKPKVKII